MKKTILLSLAAVASLAAAAPALAQPFDHFGGPRPVDARYTPDIAQRVDFLTGRVGEAQRNGVIGFRQAHRLQDQLRQVRWMEQRYRMRDGGGFLTIGQRAELSGRLDQVAGQLRFDRR